MEPLSTNSSPGTEDPKFPLDLVRLGKEVFESFREPASTF